VWNSYANFPLNGVRYAPPDGFSDIPFDYVFELPIVNGVALPFASSVTLDVFTDQGSTFLWHGLELPPWSPAVGLYGYKATVQIYVNDEALSIGVLNTASAWANQSSPLQIFPVRWLAPGTLLQIVVTSLETAVNYANFAIVFRGIKRLQTTGNRP
jgi:hypothetical protein